MRRFLQITFLLLLLAAVIGGRYLYNRGLTKSWRELVVQEVRKHGVEVSFARLTVRPFRGLVAKDVKFYDSPARNRVVAHMNEMVIEANYANAIRRKPFLDALTLVDTTLRIPVDPQNPFGTSWQVDKLNARILFPPNQVQVTRLDAVVSGIRLRASGSLLVPPGMSLTREKSGVNKVAETIVRELAALQYDGPQPVLTVSFGGDLGRPEEIAVEAQFSGEKIRRGRYSLSALTVSAILQNNVLLFQRIDATDAKGRLQASGSFALKPRTAELRLRSSLDLPALMRALKPGFLSDFYSEFPPRFDLTARAEFAVEGGTPPKFQVLGHMGAGEFVFGGVKFTAASADVSWDGRRWAVRDFELRQSAGGHVITGNAQQDYDAAGTGDFRLGLTGSVSLEALAPLLGEEGRAKMSQVKFHDAPRFTISARGSAPGLDTLSASGQLHLGHTTYRGSDARSADANFRFTNGILSIDSFEIQRAEGSAKGSLACDFNNKLWHLNDVRATVFPTEVAIWIDPDLVHDVKPYRFGRRPPVLHLDGVFDPRKGGTRTRLTVNAEAPGGLDYTFAKKDLHFGAMKGRLFFTDESVRLTDVRGDLFGGTVMLDGEVSTLKSKPGESLKVRLAGVDFSKLTRLYFGFDDSKGRLDGFCAFTSRGGDVRTLRGDGELSIAEGNVFAIPFLGPLSEILNKLVPGMGYSRARKANATFSMAEGILTNKDLLVTASGFSMFGGGRIWLTEDKIDYDIRINAQGLPGVLLFPVSKLLEYRANSRFTKPDWRPKALQGARQ